MIDFHRVTIDDRLEYNKILMAEPARGCEYSFANLCLWGRQQIACLHGCAVFFSHYNGRSLYPFPIGSGDKKAAIEALMADAEERGIAAARRPCGAAHSAGADHAAEPMKTA